MRSITFQIFYDSIDAPVLPISRNRPTARHVVLGVLPVREAKGQAVHRLGKKESVHTRPTVEPVCSSSVNSAGLTDEEQAAKREALRLELAKKMKEELNAKRMGTVQAWGEPAEQQV